MPSDFNVNLTCLRTRIQNVLSYLNKQPCVSFQVFWLKNGEMIDVEKEINYIISNEGNLIINQARLEDMGNYTCGAQNVASRRLSESATLTVYGKLA